VKIRERKTWLSIKMGMGFNKFQVETVQVEAQYFVERPEEMKEKLVGGETEE